MDKVLVDILIIALNKIEFDARLSNFINTFLKNDFKIATITLDAKYFDHPKLLSYKITLSERLKTYQKTYYFYKLGLKHLDWICPKVIICSDIYSLPLGVKFRKRYKAKLIYDSREIYSSLASLSSKPLKQSLLYLFEKNFVRKVDTIVVTGDLDKDYLSGMFSNKEFFVVYNYPKKVEELLAVDLRMLLGLPPQTILSIYQGALLAGRGIEIAIQSLLFNNNLHLVIAGEGPLELKLKNLANSLNVVNQVHFLGAIPYNELLRFTKSCDIGLCLIQPVSFSYQLALPNKLFEYIQSGIPVLATNLPAIQKVFSDYTIGELVSSETTPEELAKKILFIANNKDKYKHALKIASETFVWENQEDLILKLVQ